MTRLAASIVAFFLLFAGEASAQNVFPTPTGPTTVGVVVMCMNGSSQAVPCSSLFPLNVNVDNASPYGPHDTPNSVTTNCATDQCGQIYFTIAASQTGQILGSTGAINDYLGFCVMYPTSVSPGVLTVFDSTSSGTNNVIAFQGGTSSLSNLGPISFPVGAVSKNGAWKVTTGANMVVTCTGHFT